VVVKARVYESAYYNRRCCVLDLDTVPAHTAL